MCVFCFWVPNPSLVTTALQQVNTLGLINLQEGGSGYFEHLQKSRGWPLFLQTNRKITDQCDWPTGQRYMLRVRMYCCPIDQITAVWFFPSLTVLRLRLWCIQETMHQVLLLSPLVPPVVGVTDGPIRLDLVSQVKLRFGSCHHAHMFTRSLCKCTFFKVIWNNGFLLLQSRLEASLSRLKYMGRTADSI